MKKQIKKEYLLWFIMIFFSGVLLLGSCSSDDSSSPTGIGEGVDPGARGNPSFTLTWSYSEDSEAEGPDIDCWVVDPYGQTLSTSRDGYSLGPTPEGGEIDFDDQGATGPGDGGGPERVYWPDGQAPSGRYTYGVRYYEGIGTAYYTMRVYKNNTLVATKTGTLACPDGYSYPLGPRVTLGTIDIP